MEKVNYGRILDEKLAELEKSGEHPSLLLHACCAPCSSYTLEYLSSRFDITLYFCNPNIAPEDEFDHRFSELKRLVHEMGLAINVIEEPYDAAPFLELAKGLEDMPERSLRCQRCIEYRLRMAGAKAAQLGADYFSTTLTISPHKDCRFINQCGAGIAEEVGVPYLFSDLKKHDGYKRSIELSREYGLYRQDYCGCVYSKMKREQERAAAQMGGCNGKGA